MTDYCHLGQQPRQSTTRPGMDTNVRIPDKFHAVILRGYTSSAVYKLLVVNLILNLIPSQYQEWIDFVEPVTEVIPTIKVVVEDS